MYSNDFEYAFSQFLDRREYDEAENALFTMVRIAFAAGWKAAGGKPPQSQQIVQLISPQNAPSNVEKTGKHPIPFPKDQENTP